MRFPGFIIAIAVFAQCGHTSAIHHFVLGPQQWIDKVKNIPEALHQSVDKLLMGGEQAEEKKFDPESDPWTEQISASPRAYYFHNFLTEFERLHMIEVAAPQLKRSTVYNLDAHAGEMVQNMRTSYGTFLRRLQDPVISAIEMRIAEKTQLPVVHQEPIQVIRYSVNQSYEAHWDFLWEENDRVATFIMYLNDVDEGGETTFPHTRTWAKPGQEERFGPFSECGKGLLSIRPKKGDAMMFWSLKDDGTRDQASLHAACPVLRGVKWSAPVWIHASPFQADTMRANEQFAPLADPGICEDTHKMCGGWAADGQCAINPETMMGTDDSLGNCRMSCNKCSVCEPGDAECINRNRGEHGYLKLEAEELISLGLNFWQLYNK